MKGVVFVFIILLFLSSTVLISNKAFGSFNADGTYFCNTEDLDVEKYSFRDQIDSFNNTFYGETPQQIAQEIVKVSKTHTYWKDLDDLGKSYQCLRDNFIDPNSVNHLSGNILDGIKYAASQDPETVYKLAPFFAKNVFHADYCKTVKIDNIKTDYEKTVKKINDEASTYREDYSKYRKAYNENTDLPFTEFAADMVEFYPYDFISAGDEARCLSQNNVSLDSVARFNSILPDVFKSNLDAVNKVSPDFVRYVLNNDSTVPEFGPVTELVILVGIIGSIVIYRRFSSGF